MLLLNFWSNSSDLLFNIFKSIFVANHFFIGFYVGLDFVENGLELLGASTQYTVSSVGIPFESHTVKLLAQIVFHGDFLCRLLIFRNKSLSKNMRNSRLESCLIIK